MSRITTFLLLLSMILLSACVSKRIHLQAHQTKFDGLVTQLIHFKIDGNQYQWVCYSELNQQILVGISCQNDTALQLFSGGLVNGIFEFDYPSRYLIKIPPNHMLAYIKMSLFEVLDYDLAHIEIIKSPQKTTISDNKRKVKLTLSML